MINSLNLQPSFLLAKIYPRLLPHRAVYYCHELALCNLAAMTTPAFGDLVSFCLGIPLFGPWKRSLFCWVLCVHIFLSCMWCVLSSPTPVGSINTLAVCQARFKGTRSKRPQQVTTRKVGLEAHVTATMRHTHSLKRSTMQACLQDGENQSTMKAPIMRYKKAEAFRLCNPLKAWKAWYSCPWMTTIPTAWPTLSCVSIPTRSHDVEFCNPWDVSLVQTCFARREYAYSPTLR
jgi:hypothetical protein